MGKVNATTNGSVRRDNQVRWCMMKVYTELRFFGREFVHRRFQAVRSSIKV
jgi:hypothetical protein